ncbi:MAG: helix-turn-helix domain-containing protein [Bacilli bacterium]|nr:helix-turn-helix domain-containing protein [Bacilli bacterium]
MEQFGEKLKELRTKNGESQKKLAEILNVSFQSISKWEQSIHYPDVFLIEKIAMHYNVNINYLFDNEIIKEIKSENKIEHFKLVTTINHSDSIVTWTDYEYEGTIAPIANLDSRRHCAGNRFIKTHPGPKGYLIIAVNEKNEICFMAEHRDHPYFPICGPIGEFYSRLDGIGKANPCFIIEESYESRGQNAKDFEFVIPKNGILINIPYQSIETKNLLMFIVSNRLRKKIQNYFPNVKISGRTLFNGLIITNELNNVKVYLEDNQIVFEKEFSCEEIREDLSDNNTRDYIEDLEYQINDLESRLEILEEQLTRFDELEQQIDNLDSRLCDME